MRIAFPGITAKIEDERDSFSPDWRFVAWADDNGMIGLGRFDSGRSAYVPAGTVTPPKPSFDGDQVTYDVPRFSPATGRLWFRVHKTATETALVSVDPRSPAGPPRTEQAPPGMGIGWYFAPTGTPVGSDDQTARLTGTSGKKLVLTYLGSAAELMKARIRDGVGRHDPSSTFDEYEEFARLDGTTFLALNSASAIEKYGPLIEVRTDLAHKRATVTKLVPGTGQNQITGAVLGPDHRSLLLDTARGWFRTELGSTAEPQPAFDRLGDPDMGDASDLGWF